jgi:hypothetical protein
VVREHDLVQLRDDPRRADEVAEAGRRHRPRLGERPGHHQRPLLVDQLERRPGGELPVGLVDDEQPADVADGGEHRLDGAPRLDPARRVVGRAQERDRRTLPSDGRRRDVGVEGEVVAAVGLDDVGAAHPGDVGVQRIRRLEGERTPTGTAVGEAQRLEHLVGPVRREHLSGLDALELGDAGPQDVGAPVRVPVPGQASQLVGQPGRHLGRRRIRGLVGVEAHLDVDLR